ncbi:hypothetical protein [Pandoraea sputorum]|uniref:Uncharacterized protein n=1 Tax=Pandoraea sputorum TaxID=93222 RepID=A0A239SQI2_9BURK|nr:hypothetical protein [Pandoraea sputorum]SNU87004.1 Uncharacterised protein [Pandoraea sputorum]
MKRLLFIALCLSLVTSSTNDAYANPLARAFTTFVINQVVALVTQKTIQRDGVKPDDPRIEETQKAMSLVATEHARLSLNERYLMAANGPTWFGLAAVLLGEQLGELAVGKIGDTDITISALPSGEIEAKSERYVPIPDDLKPYVPPRYPRHTVGRSDSPWDAIAAMGGQVYRQSQCRQGWVCAHFPPVPWDDVWGPQGWYAADKDGVIVLGRSLAQIKSYIQAYVEEGFKLANVKARNLRIRIEEEFRVSGESAGFETSGTYEKETCEIKKEKVIDVTLPGCPAENVASAAHWSGKCTKEIEKEICTWKSVEASGFSLGAPFVNHKVVPPFNKDNYGRQVRHRTFDSLDKAYDALSDDELKLELAPKFVADVTNSLFAKASQLEGYRGVPHRMTSPITPQDVKAWSDEKGRGAMPAVVDVFSRPLGDYERVVPINVLIVPDRRRPEDRPDPNDRNRPVDPDRERPRDPLSKDVNVVNTPGVHVVNPVQVDAGQASAIGEPSLESPPTPSAILSPILNLLPDFKKWKTPRHTATCPKPVFDVFDKRITMDAMCEIAERHRKTIHMVMLAVFALIALTILLAA